jgi:hypothetical protein
MKRFRLEEFVARSFVCLLLIVGAAAHAWDGTSTGTISAIEVTNGTNQGFRIYLTGVTAMCSGGTMWAYLNDDDSNYKTYAAALMMAKAQASTVTIFTTLVSGYYMMTPALG